MPRLSHIGVIVVLAIGVCIADDVPQSRTNPEATSPEEAHDADPRDEQMRELVDAITVRRLSDGLSEPQNAELIDQPLMRYSDQQRRFPDATVWGWQIDGRPLAFSKVERVISPVDGNLGWQYCFVSLSESLIDARWSDGESCASENGVTWRNLPNAPRAHRSPKGRLVQMKGLARRFEAAISNPELKQKEQMRLLPTPILRYSSDAHDVIDGGIFGFTSKGTNPDTLLLLESQPSGNESTWQYAVVGTTGDAVGVQYNGQEVWSKETTSGPGDHNNWIWRVDWDQDSPGEAK